MPRVEFAGKKVTIQRIPSKARKLPSKYEINPHLARRKEISHPKTQIVESLNNLKLNSINCLPHCSKPYLFERDSTKFLPPPALWHTCLKSCFFGKIPRISSGFPSSPNRLLSRPYGTTSCSSTTGDQPGGPYTNGWSTYPPRATYSPPRHSRLYDQWKTHWFPLIRPKIKPLFLGWG